ncbi:MAG: histidinol dehydrogenase [Clostridiales bacterium]|jgi:histidinol dehydrogenase|nr:histidinol dehydrogenase [Clostridiales bacterium]
MTIIDYDNGGAAFLAKRRARGDKDNATAQAVVNEILANVKARGDEAVLEYTKRFDHADIVDMMVSDEEIHKAVEAIDQQLLAVLRRAFDRIKAFHEKQKQNSWFETSPNGEILGQLVRPIVSVGVYVPGGLAFYPSSLIMSLAPAIAAGVERIAITTPPNANGMIEPVTLAAAAICGVREIYKVGGAQAIGALAYGTQTIPKVDKIVGPGNIWVALAKKSVYGDVGVDSIAGPSEILVVADKSANPVYVAADLLSQAEHNETASSILITDSAELARQVAEEVDRQMAVLPRKEIINKSIKDYGAIIIVSDLKQAMGISNSIAPEHLEIATDNPFALLPLVQNAGSVFLGHFSPEPLGDYMAGPNHILPTDGTARFFSAQSVDDFIKKTGIVSFSKEALAPLAKDIIIFAEAERLSAHANAIRVRQAAN